MEKTYQRINHINYLGNLKRLISGLFLLSAFWSFDAKSLEIKLISDEETESFLADIIQPLFNAAGINFNRNDIYIVEDNSLNAFVADGNKLFIYTGTIIKADNVNELAGVIAHETGHIAGGHIFRQKLKNKEMYKVSMISAILAGATAAVGGRGDMAMAVLLGGQSSALSHYTKYRTEEERSADEAAIKLLNYTKQSPVGILNFMKKINKDNMLSGRIESPYFRTHPITSERISFFEKKIANSPYSQSSNLDNKFTRIKAKLKSYLLPSSQIWREYPTSKTDINSEYAQTIAYLKELKFTDALQKINNLQLKEPNNPFFYEIKGQILMETGKLSEAKDNFAKAYQYLPNSHLMQINYAHAIIENDPTQQDVKQAISLLNKALFKNQNSFVWLLLSQAYGKINDIANANYASAEYSIRIGNIDVAKKQLNEADKYPTSKQLKLKINDLRQRLNNIDKAI